MAGQPADIWQRSARRRFRSVPEVHDELVVLFATAGRMNYLIDGQIVRMRPGILLFAFAGQAHVLLSETKNFDMWVVLVSAGLLSETQIHCLPPLTVHEAVGMTGPRLLMRSEMEELDGLASVLAGETDADRKSLGISWWLSRAWGHWQKAGSDAAQRLHPALDQAAFTIKRDPSLRLTEVAGAVGLSPEHLGRLFHSELGEAFLSFRRRVRLDRVDGILAETPKANLLQAALEGGFGSYPQFYRTFRALRGQSPHAYYKAERDFDRGEAANATPI